MKKRLLVLALGMSFSMLSFAANTSSELVTDDTNKGQIPVTETDCELLKEPVVIGLSNGVVGGYACNTDTNTIAIGMCHPNGRKFGTTSANRITYVASSAGGKIQEDDEGERLPCDDLGVTPTGKAVTKAAEPPETGG